MMTVLCAAALEKLWSLGAAGGWGFDLQPNVQSGLCNICCEINIIFRYDMLIHCSGHDGQ